MQNLTSIEHTQAFKNKVLAQIEIIEIAEKEQRKLSVKYDWRRNARPSQLPPDGNWYIWLILAGRGFGKTRTGAEMTREIAESGIVQFITLVGRTPAEIRDVMIEGQSGILNISPKWNMPNYEPSKSRLTWPNGVVANLRSAEAPDSCRGLGSGFIWIDELASYKKAQDVWDNLMFGLRAGENPRVIISTTPKNIPLIKELVKDENCVVTRGSSYENKDNLAKPFLDRIIKKYEGTRLGRQEIYAEVIEDVEGALWHYSDIDHNRIKKEEMPDLVRIAIGVDPAVTANAASDDTGIIIAGIDREQKGYILADKTLKGTPKEWAKEVISALGFYKASQIIAETNNGGDLVKINLETIQRNFPFKKVHASKGKLARAEPVSSLYEQNKVHHVGTFPELEDELCNYTGDATNKSPNRLDALVWVLTELMLKSSPIVYCKSC